MKRIILISIVLFTALVSAATTKPKSEITGIWNVLKIETTDQSLNLMMQDADLSKLSIEFAKSGTVLISGKDTKTKYSVKGDKIILSEGMIKERSEVKKSIKSGNLSINIPADLVKQILLIIREHYVKSGGDSFIAKMIESIANTYSIEAVITLKRK
jgi:hypothetical protein